MFKHLKYKSFFTGLIFTGVLCALPAAAQKPPQNAGVPVIVANVELVEWAKELESTGTLKGKEEVHLTASVAGKVASIHFEDGQFVQEGTLLVQIENGEEKAELEAAKSLLRETQKQYKRSKELRSQGATAQSVLDAHRREFEIAKAQVNVAQARLDDQLIQAPFSGQMGLRQLSPGAYVQAGDVIATLTDSTTMRLDFSIPELYAPRLRIGQAVTALSRAYPGQEFVGHVTAVESFIDPMTRAVGVRALLPNLEKSLSAGMLMTVRLTQAPRDVVMIPESAVVAESTANYVYVVDEAVQPLMARKTKMTLGARRPGEVEVLSGLVVGQKIVAHGALKLADGRPIRILAVKDRGTPLVEILQQSQPRGK